MNIFQPITNATCVLPKKNSQLGGYVMVKSRKVTKARKLKTNKTRKARK